MKTFVIKAILISFGLLESIDIGLFFKNLTYTFSKSSGEFKVSLFIAFIKECCFSGVADIRTSRLCLQPY